MPKRKKHMQKGVLKTANTVRLSPSEVVKFFTEKISRTGGVTLWKERKGYAKDASNHITWAAWVNGTTFKGVSPVGVTVCTTDDGFALLFIGEDTSE